VHSHSLVCSSSVETGACVVVFSGFSGGRGGGTPLGPLPLASTSPAFPTNPRACQGFYRVVAPESAVPSLEPVGKTAIVSTGDDLVTGIAVSPDVSVLQPLVVDDLSTTRCKVYLLDSW
jgi:hypothetical protein